MGSLYGGRSPAAFPHPCFYAEAVLAPGAVLPLDPDYEMVALPRADADNDETMKFHRWLDQYAEKIVSGEDVSKRLA